MLQDYYNVDIHILILILRASIAGDEVSSSKVVTSSSLHAEAERYATTGAGADIGGGAVAGDHTESFAVARTSRTLPPGVR